MCYATVNIDKGVICQYNQLPMAVELEPRKLRAQEVADLDPYKVRQFPQKEKPKTPRKPRVRKIPSPQSEKNEFNILTSQLKDLNKDLINAFRAHLKDQKELWELVPDLCLEAEGKTGFQDDTWMIVEERIFPFGNMEIDLRNGNLVYWDYRERKKKPASDYMVSGLDFNELEGFSALNILQDLIKRAKAPYGSYYSAEEQAKTEASKEQQRQEFGLNRPDYNKINKTIKAYKQRKGIK